MICHRRCISASASSGSCSRSRRTAPSYDWSTCARCSGPRERVLFTPRRCQWEGPRRTLWSKTTTRAAPVLWLGSVASVS